MSGGYKESFIFKPRLGNLGTTEPDRDVIFKAHEKELRPLGITTAQAAALFVIEAIGNKVTATEVSR